jgi:hypothetical protein
MCNMALIKLGAQVITALTENSKAAKACNTLYETVRDMVLIAHDWPCAIERQSLARSADLPITGDFSYKYALPVTPKCLRVINMPDTPTAVYVIEDNMLFTSETTVVIRYVKEIKDTSKFSVPLAKAIAYRLGAEIAYHLTEDTKKETMMEQLYIQALHEAEGLRDMEHDPPGQDNTEWIDAGIA